MSWEIEEQKNKLRRLRELGKGLKDKSGWRLEVAEQEALIRKLKEKQKKRELESE